MPRPAPQCKRHQALGAPAYALLCGCAGRTAITPRIRGRRDRSSDSAPVLAWRTDDPDAADGHAPAHHVSALLRGFRVHPVRCRGAGWPAFFRGAPATSHAAPFTPPLRAAIVARDDRRPRVVRLAAAYGGHPRMTCIHPTRGATAVIPWNPQRTKDRPARPPPWTRDEVGKRGSSERFFGRIVLFFHLQRPRVVGWTAATQQGALPDTASIVVARAAHADGRDDLIRSP